MPRTPPLLGMLLGPCLWGACAPEKPPAPEAAPQQGAAAGAAETAGHEREAVYEAGVPAVLTYAAARGEFKDTGNPEDIPEEARGLVRVVLLDGPRPAPDRVWVANFKAGTGGKVPLQTVPRELFEELALGEGRSSEARLPAGLELPEVVQREGIIVYKTAWCGVCKKLEAYLQRKGIEYVAKDIEEDREAAAELQVKANEQGVKAGSVPVIDVNGQLVVGFDRARLEKLLG